MLHDTCVQMVSGCQQSDNHPKVHSIDILTAAKSYVDDTNWVYSGAIDPYQEKTKNYETVHVLLLSVIVLPNYSKSLLIRLLSKMHYRTDTLAFFHYFKHED